MTSVTAGATGPPSGLPLGPLAPSRQPTAGDNGLSSTRCAVVPCVRGGPVRSVCRGAGACPSPSSRAPAGRITSSPLSSGLSSVHLDLSGRWGCSGYSSCARRKQVWRDMQGGGSGARGRRVGLAVHLHRHKARGTCTAGPVLVTSQCGPTTTFTRFLKKVTPRCLAWGPRPIERYNAHLAGWPWTKVPGCRTRRLCNSSTSLWTPWYVSFVAAISSRAGWFMLLQIAYYGVRGDTSCLTLEIREAEARLTRFESGEQLVSQLRRLLRDDMAGHDEVHREARVALVDLQLHVLRDARALAMMNAGGIDSDTFAALQLQIEALGREAEELAGGDAGAAA